MLTVAAALGALVGVRLASMYTEALSVRRCRGLDWRGRRIE